MMLGSYLFVNFYSFFEISSTPQKISNLRIAEVFKCKKITTHNWWKSTAARQIVNITTIVSSLTDGSPVNQP